MDKLRIYSLPMITHSSVLTWLLHEGFRLRAKARPEIRSNYRCGGSSGFDGFVLTPHQIPDYL
jgi:hypothetical protein